MHSWHYMRRRIGIVVGGHLNRKIKLTMGTFFTLEAKLVSTIFKWNHISYCNRKVRLFYNENSQRPSKTNLHALTDFQLFNYVWDRKKININLCKDSDLLR